MGTCTRALRRALPCKTNCPPLTMLGSLYALLLPLWLQAFPCEQTLVLEREGIFKEGPAGGYIRKVATALDGASCQNGVYTSERCTRPASLLPRTPPPPCSRMRRSLLRNSAALRGVISAGRLSARPASSIDPADQLSAGARIHAV